MTREVITTPVRFEDEIVGRAEISECGEIISIELQSGDLPQNLRAALLVGLADGITLAPNYVPVQPISSPEERKKARWFSKTTPWGM